MSYIPSTFGEVTLEWRLGSSRPAFTVFGIDNPGLPANLDATCELIFQNFTDNVMDELSLGVELISCSILDGDGFIGRFDGSTVGGETGSMASVNTCYLIDKRTNVAGRRNHGSMFLPGVNEDLVDSLGTIQAAQRIDLQVAVDAFIEQLSTDGFNMVILHSQYRNAEGDLVPPDVDDLPAPSVVTKLRVDPLAATQRRRMR